MAKTEPEILSVLADSMGVHIELRVPADACWFDGHFPGCPLLPGVIQVTWAIQLARQYLQFPAHFHSLSAMKFMRFILPGTVVLLSVRFDNQRSALWFQYCEREAICASGHIGFI